MFLSAMFIKKYILLTFFLTLGASNIWAAEEHKWNMKNPGSIAPIESFDSQETDSTSSTSSASSASSNTSHGTENRKAGSVVPESASGIANKNQKQTWYQWFAGKKASLIAPERSPQGNTSKKKKSKKIHSVVPAPVDQNAIIAYQLKQEAELPKSNAVKGLSWQTQKVRANILAEQAGIDNIKERLNSCMSRCVRNADELFSGRENDLQNICSDNCIRQERAVLAEIKRELENLIEESEARLRRNY